MQAIWLENNAIDVRDDLDMPVLQPGEALVRVRVAGICSTDLELIKGYYPYTGVLGHEFVGEIMEAPAAPERIAQRVVGDINVACGKCIQCQAGRPTHCVTRTVLGIVNHDGAFAEYLKLPLENLVRVPENISDEMAVFTEPLAAALEIQTQIPVKPTDYVIVIGAGRLGLLIARTLALTGCRLEVVTRRDKQNKLLEKNGIRWVAPEDINDKRVDIVVEATGSPEGFALAVKKVRARGIIVLKSTYHGNASINLSEIVVDEITLVGSRCGPFRPALTLMEKRLIDPTDLIDEKYPLKDGLDALNAASKPGVLKVLLEMEGRAL